MSQLDEAIELVKATTKVDIKGKQYTQVKDRVEIFRKIWGLGYSIETMVLTETPYHKGDYVLFMAMIRDVDSEKVVATGHACEVVGGSPINVTSFIEAGETSAIGRALAAFGLHGGEYASSDEMERIEPKKNTIDQMAEEEFNKLAEARPINDPSRQMSGRPIPEINPPEQIIVSTGNNKLSIEDLKKVQGTFANAIKLVKNQRDLTTFWTSNEETLNMLESESEESQSVFIEIKEMFKKRGYQLAKGE
jgi:hypothetical protein